MVGLYNFQTGQRLAISSAGGDSLEDALERMTITVEPARQAAFAH